MHCNLASSFNKNILQSFILKIKCKHLYFLLATNMLRIWRHPYHLCLSHAALCPSTVPHSQHRFGVLLRAFSVGSQLRQATPEQQQTKNALAASRERADVSTDVRPLGERVKENAKTASYLGVILLGVGVTGGLIFAIMRELWSSDSPNNVYSAALAKCIEVYF